MISSLGLLTVVADWRSFQNRVDIRLSALLLLPSTRPPAAQDLLLTKGPDSKTTDSWLGSTNTGFSQTKDSRFADANRNPPTNL